MASEPPAIAVFGSSDPQPGEPLYEQARRLGRLLAEAGHEVVTGGYGGVMEGASRGAREAGGRAIGVTCEVFRERRPNLYLNEIVPSPDLHERTKRLIELSGGFVVLPGKAGSLAELAMLWALHRAGCLGDRPVILLGAAWAALLQFLEQRDLLEREQLRIARLVHTPEEALAVLYGSMHRGNR